MYKNILYVKNIVLATGKQTWEEANGTQSGAALDLGQLLSFVQFLNVKVVNLDFSPFFFFSLSRGGVETWSLYVVLDVLELIL